MAILDFFRKVWNRLIPKNNIEKQLNVTIATSAIMENAIELWGMMYENKPPWRGGEAGVIPLNLPAAISEEMARLVLTEFELSLDGSERAVFLNEQIKNSFMNINDHMELYCAKGGICMKPFVSGKTIDIDFTQADRFFPTAYNSNKEITGAIFLDTKRQGDYIYTRLECHQLVGTDYTIINKAFRSEKLSSQMTDDDYISVEHPYLTPVSLNEVKEWENLSEDPVVINNVEKPLFVYVKVPRANNLDSHSPLGASVYSRATEVIEQADRQFSRILWEYEATEAAIHASADLFDSDKKGKPILPQGRERLYRAFDFERKDSFLEEYEVGEKMAKADSIINALEQFFIPCELLKDGCLRVDYLGERPVEYTIEVLTCDPIVKRYVSGDSVRQYLFAFGSREFYSQERLQNIQNSAFYERLADWVEKQNAVGNLPELPEGMTAQKLEVTSTGYLFDGTMENARYQINLRLEYYKEAMQYG